MGNRFKNAEHLIRVALVFVAGFILFVISFIVLTISRLLLRPKFKE